MGTTKSLKLVTKTLKFRYLQGYMGTSFSLMIMASLKKFRYLQGYMGTPSSPPVREVTANLDTFKDIWEPTPVWPDRVAL